MTSTGRKILTGGGIGCLLLLLIVGGIGTCGVLALKRAAEESLSLDVAYDDLKERFGAAGDFVPAADGTIQPASLGAFIAARLAINENCAETVQTMRTLESGELSTVAEFRMTVPFIRAMYGYSAVHSHALLDQGIGIGEHAYLYTLAYYVMLEYDPGSGPAFIFSISDDFELLSKQSFSDDHAWENRARNARRDLNHLLVQVLENQRDALTESGAESPAWQAQLDAEIDAMHRDRGRLPWQDGLPANVAASLEPFRDDLEACWSLYLNAMDVTVLHEVY